MKQLKNCSRAGPDISSRLATTTRIAHQLHYSAQHFWLKRQRKNNNLNQLLNYFFQQSRVCRKLKTRSDSCKQAFKCCWNTTKADKKGAVDEHNVKLKMMTSRMGGERVTLSSSLLSQNGVEELICAPTQIDSLV